MNDTVLFKRESKYNQSEVKHLTREMTPAHKQKKNALNYSMMGINGLCTVIACVCECWRLTGLFDWRLIRCFVPQCVICFSSLLCEQATADTSLLPHVYLIPFPFRLFRCQKSCIVKQVHLNDSILLFIQILKEDLCLITWRASWPCIGRRSLSPATRVVVF